MEFEGCNIVCLDLETARSADDCRHCGKPHDKHYDAGACAAWIGGKPLDEITQFSALGWNNKSALGLSIGCYYDYLSSGVHYFDRHTLAQTMAVFVDRACLLVSFNGIAHDFPLMRGLLRQEAEALRLSESGEDLFRSGVYTSLCDSFKILCATSYDLLAEIWKVDSESKFVRGLNSLDAIAQANGLPAKAMTGTEAPRLWAEGHYAEVMGYCAADVDKTRQLFERVCRGEPLMRGNGKPIVLPPPSSLDTLKPL